MLKFQKRKKHLGLMLIALLLIVIGVLSYMIYYLKAQNNVQIIPEEYFHINTGNETNLENLAKSWTEQYVSQYMQKYLNKERALEDLNIENVEVLDQANKIVRVDFSVNKVKFNSKFFSNKDWGVEQESKIICNWVINLNLVTSYYDGGDICFITRRVRPAAYDLEQYNSSGQAETDKEYSQFMNKKKYEDLSKDFTYKIEKGKVFVTYDKSNTWVQVNTSFNGILDNSSYKLEDGFYKISPEVTVIACQKGNSKVIAYSSDKGATWKNIKYSTPGTIMYINFIDKDIGYIVLAQDVAMGNIESEIIKTTDGGVTWTEVSNGVDGDLRRGTTFNFLTKDVGFIVEPTADGSKSTLYRTEDGCKSFKKVELAPQKLAGQLDGDTSKWNDIYDTPELPKYENGIITLVVSQGSDGDYSGGTKAAYKSIDMGKTWEYIEEFKPKAEPWEG